MLMHDHSNILIDIPNARCTMPGVCSGGRPQPHHFEAAREKGIRVVINLCPHHEPAGYDEEAVVTAMGMRYVNIPVAGPMDLTREKAQQLSAVLESCSHEHPALLHCGSGNRVGALLALKAYWLDGECAEDALKFGLESGLTMLEPVVRQHLGL